MDKIIKLFVCIILGVIAFYMVLVFLGAIITLFI